MSLVNEIKHIKRLVVSGLFRPHIKKEPGNHEMRHIGNEYGGYTVACDMLSDHPVVLSFGIGEDMSFEQGMIDEGAEVYAFDPTPRAAKYVSDHNKSEKFHFDECGLSDIDGEVDFFFPKNKSFVSGSEVMNSHLDETDRVKVKMKTLDTVMAELGKTHFDVIKMDIEGSEFKIIDDLVRLKDCYDQLCMEIHYLNYKDGNNKLRVFVARIQEAGFKVTYINDTTEVFSFGKSK